MAVFLFLFLAFVAVGAVCAVREDKKPKPPGAQPEESSRLLITRRVPSVFESFRRR